jgi:serine/threonine protein kinase
MAVRAPDSSPRPEEAMGRYELVRPLAVGGMAELHLARFRSIEGFEKLAVVKRLRPEYAQSSDMVNMFLGEARLLANMQHPNVVHVYDVGSESGSFYFAMEYLRGQDVRHVLRKAGRVPLENALFIVASALAGLHYMHERRGPDGVPLGIVHRDVSPANLFVTYDGTPKVLDLGIAKVESSHETKAGVLKGKVRYMAPEQIDGTKVDRRTDVFAAGIVLWELTVGRRLFEGKDVAVLLQIAVQEVELPSSSCPGYPPELERIVMKALERDPARRYATAREMQQDIEGFAREARLALSAAGLEAFMAHTFEAELQALNAAQRADHLSAHLLETRSDAMSKSGIVSGSRSNPATTKALPAPWQSGPRWLMAGAGALALLLAVMGLVRLFAPNPPAAAASPSAPTPSAAPAAVLSLATATPMPAPKPEAAPSTVAAPTDARTAAPPARPNTSRSRSFAGSPSRPGPSDEETRPAAASCNPPYTVDTNGIEHFKPGCL